METFKHTKYVADDFIPVVVAKKIIFNEKSVVDQIDRILDLPNDHIAVQLLLKRKIPTKFHQYFYYTDKFCTWVNSWNPGKFESTKYDHPRLIIAFRDVNKKLIAIQGRSFDDNNKPKYLTLKVDTNVDNVFGLDIVDHAKNVKILEGPIDSMFVNNAIAVGNAGLNNPNLDDVTYIWDNEPRNKQIVNLMIKKVNSEPYSKIVIWQSTDRLLFKDINDLAMIHNLSLDKIDVLINKNTFKGLEALFAINRWKK